MKSETKSCQNCQKDFTIESDDFAFYEKMKVPAPTFCTDCRFQRRLAFRNERNLYPRKCGLCQADIISIYHEDSSYNVFCQKCWWSDDWDPMKYGKEYNFNKTFFNQINDLFQTVPIVALFNINAVNSDYCNFTYQSKNCYLNFASDMNEDTAFLYHSIENKNCFDMLGSRKNENCYNLLDCEKCYESKNLTISEGCINCQYCYDCRNCQSCLGCSGLRNKSYCIFNKQYTQEEYEKRVKDLKPETLKGRDEIEGRFLELLKNLPRKFSNSRHVVNSTGDYLKHTKNCINSFDIEGPAEYLKYSTYGVTNMQSIYDAYAFGVNIENCYEILGSGDNTQKILFSMYVFSGSFNCEYCFLLNGCSDCFGCVGLRNKKYCILNKQYTKEEYFKLIKKIKKKMLKDGEYGEFFPIELSPFCYNETIAQEYFPLTKQEALKKGYRWKEEEDRDYKITIKPEDLPDDISEVSDEIIKEVLGCATPEDERIKNNCTTAFKIIQDELQFYKKINLPLPRYCPNCRHHYRLKQRNPLKLWKRTCMKEGCKTEFETTYAPERKEIVYCGQCYQNEII